MRGRQGIFNRKSLGYKSIGRSISLAGDCVGCAGLSGLGDNFGVFANLIGVQTNLQAEGFYTGNIDGVWGPLTAAAIRAYVTRYGRSAAESRFGATLVSRAATTSGGTVAPAATEEPLPGVTGGAGGGGGILGGSGLPSWAAPLGIGLAIFVGGLYVMGGEGK